MNRFTLCDILEGKQIKTTDDLADKLPSEDPTKCSKKKKKEDLGIKENMSLEEIYECMCKKNKKKKKDCDCDEKECKCNKDKE